VKVMTVLGTRPEVIKLAPVVHELEREPAVDSIVVSTGQHRAMLDQMLGVFEVRPDVDLDVMRPGQRLSDLTAALMERLGETLRAFAPDRVLVQGDTTTALCGALAAFYEGIPVGHVEAGLRSFDPRSPFPEEANRRLAGALADLHFCPTPRAAANLEAEGVLSDRILVTGNTVVDALLWAVERTSQARRPLAQMRRRRVLVTLHRRESHGPVLRRICEAIRALAGRGDVEVVFPVHPNPAVLAEVWPVLGDVEGVCVCEPLDYLELVAVLSSSDLVLTDSGGLQEEAPSLGKPVLVLRDTTERPEAIEAGVARLVGTEPASVYATATELLDDPIAYAAMARAENPFGDGLARLRIVEAVLDGDALEAAA
jgi:UDP-N-acetylglucosamine 2-epimerase (non-hydrolysing)